MAGARLAWTEIYVSLFLFADIHPTPMLHLALG